MCFIILFRVSHLSLKRIFLNLREEVKELCIELHNQ